MLTKTSISAIRALTYLGIRGAADPVSPKHVAEQLGESPTYLAKVMRHLVRSGILRAHRGAGGGVTLNRSPEEVTLLTVVEACQGTILGDFCEEASELANTCAFHQAAAELHTAIVGVLSRWTLSEFVARPRPTGAGAENIRCLLEPIPDTARLERPARSVPKPSTD